MNDWLLTLNHLSSVWADGMVRACWQGGSAVLLVWGLCRALATMPPAARCWLWRLAYLKLLVALVWAGSIELPLLPAPVLPVESASSRLTPPDATGGTGEQASSSFLAAAGHDSQASDGAEVRTTLQGSFSLAWPTPASWLLAAWIVGAGWHVVRIVRTWRGVRHQLARSRRLADPQVTAMCAELSGKLGLRRAPELRTSDAIRCPSLVGVTAPAVVLPSALLQACSAAELRLAVAHELSHLRRRDLLWNWLPALGEVLFFFHPLVWLARREWRFAQELACDQMAAGASHATAAELGRLLLRVAFQRRFKPCPSLLTAEVSTSFPQIRRRLIAMKCSGRLARKRNTVAAAMVCFLVGLGVVIPWHVTARELRSDEERSTARAPSSVETAGGAPATPKDPSAECAAEHTVSDAAPAEGAGRVQLSRVRELRVAVVDINHLFKHHERFAESVANIRREIKAANADVRQEQDEIKRLVKRLQALDPVTADPRQLEEEIARRRAELEVEIELSRGDFVKKEAAAYNATYDAIVEAITRFAEEHQIDVVYRKETTPARRASGDSGAGVTASAMTGTREDAGGQREKGVDEALDPQSVLAKINRHVVYRRNEWDITPEILKMLNGKQMQPAGPEVPNGSDGSDEADRPSTRTEHH